MKPTTVLPAAQFLALALALAAPGTRAADAPAPASASLQVFTVQSAAAGALASSVDAQVEAVREATLSAQVAGAVVGLPVQAGDRVAAGQELVRIDARAAQQTAAAGAAQVEAARAGLQVAAKEYERQQQLFRKQYISQAALDRAEAQWRASQAQVQALQAQAGAAATQSGLHSVRAPYAGVVGSRPAALGDMALPGKPLLTLYDPARMRVTAFVAQQQAAQLQGQVRSQAPVQVEIPGLASARIAVPAASVQVLPTVDAQSLTVQVRVELPASVAGAAPGMFARLWLPAAAGAPGDGAAPVLVPAAAVVRRAEMTALYVLDAQGRPLLRQVRLGRPAGDMVEVLGGLRAGERVALQPQVAAKVR